MAKNTNGKGLPAVKVTKNKRWTKKKIIALSILGAAALSFVIFISIVLVNYFTGVRPIKSTDDEAKVVGEIAGYDIRYEELRYVTLLHRQSLDAKIGKYDTLDEEGKAKYKSELEERVLQDIKSNYVIFSLCEDYGIDTNSREAKNYVQDSVEELVEVDFGGDFEKYKAWLSENALTDAFLRTTLKAEYLENALYDHFVENKIGISYDEESRDKLVDYILEKEGEEWIRTIHVFYPKESPYYDVSKSKPGAESARDQLKAVGNDKERLTLMEKSLIGNAPTVEGYSTMGNGFYFTIGAMGEAYENAAFALDAYGVSDVVETDAGYYVIMRVPMEKDHLKQMSNDLLEQYRYAALKKKLDEKDGKISFDGNDYFASVDLLKIK